jgi:hypothetical protein
MMILAPAVASQWRFTCARRRKLSCAFRRRELETLFTSTPKSLHAITTGPRFAVGGSQKSSLNGVPKTVFTRMRAAKVDAPRMKQVLDKHFVTLTDFLRRHVDPLRPATRRRIELMWDTLCAKRPVRLRHPVSDGMPGGLETFR